MKTLNKRPKITYSKDVDILMIQLTNEKVDDAYDTDNMIVQTDKKGKPVILEIFNGQQFLKDLNQAFTNKIQPTQIHSVAHRIK